MAITLTIIDQRNPTETLVRTFMQHKVTIGRARYCDICLPDLSVSTCHGEVRLQGNDFCLVDLGSLNGTFFEQRKLIAHRPKKLSNGDVFCVSYFEIRFQLGVSQGKVPERNVAQAQALQLLGKVLSMSPAPTVMALVVVAGPGRAMRFELQEEPSLAVIGRSKQVDICLDDKDVSRKHAEVVCRDGQIVVRDLSSRNGILHNDVRSSEFVLSMGDTFTIGNTTLGLEHPLDPSLAHIQNAPEEETSSYCVGGSISLFPAMTPLSQPASASETGEKILESAPQSALADTFGEPSLSANEQNEPQLPTGPSDPLAPRDTTDYVKTQQLPQLVGEEKSDWGLIVVGAIVVVSCVLALVWLLT